MADVYVYAPKCDDFDNIGLAGSLTPSSCLHTEIKNGMSEIEIIHPIDEMGKWSYLQEEALLLAEVPVHQTPEIIDGTLVTSIEKWKVRLAAPKAERKLYNKATGGKTITTLKAGTACTVVSKGDTRYKIKTAKYTGWIIIAALDNKVVTTIPNDPSAIQTAEPPWTARPQRFRIYKVEKNDEEVVALAKHIFFDHQQNNTTYKAGNPTLLETINGLVNGCSAPNDLSGTTNLLDRRAGVGWERVGFTEAIQAPDTGVTDLWGVERVLDNEEFTLLKSAGMNRGVRIEYGKNLRGVEMVSDISPIITRYIPEGKNNKGGLLLLTPGTYTTNHGTVVIPSGRNWIESSNAGDYAVPHIAPLKTNVKATGTSDTAIKEARAALIDAVLDAFENEQPQYIKFTLSVDFEQLGDTDEYAQYRQLENVYLYDWVRVRHPKINIDVLAQVIEYEWDVLLGRASKITLGNVKPTSLRRSVPMWELPAVIPGERLAVNSLTAGNAITINEGVFEVDMTGTPDGLTLVIHGGDEGEEVMRHDANGTFVERLAVGERIDCDMVAWRYNGPTVFMDTESLVPILDALNYCYLDDHITIVLADGADAFDEEIALSGIHGPGTIHIYGSQRAASLPVKITGCVANITFHELYAQYVEVRSPYCHYVDCSATGSYTASGTASDTANPTRTRRVQGGSGGWIGTTDYAWQGYTSGAGQHYAAFWFPDMGAYAGATILSAKIKLRRVAGSGKGDKVKLIAYTATNSGPSGGFTGLVYRGQIGTIDEGEKLTVSISTAAAAVLCAGGCLVLDPGDEDTLSGKSYSSNYAKFYGVGTGHEPVLTITYELEGETVTKDSTFTAELEPEWTPITLLNGSNRTTGDNPMAYRRIGNHVFLRGTINMTYSGTQKDICNLPFPTSGNHDVFAKCAGANIASLIVRYGSNTLILGSIVAVSNGANQTAFSGWLDCTVDYWTD